LLLVSLNATSQITHRHMIAILDYGIGNLKSIRNMFKKVGHQAVVTADCSIIKEAKKIILPGVGAFDHGIRKLRSSPFFQVLEEQVHIKKKPLLGICLGMQLLTSGSEEGREEGLGWIEGTTKLLHLGRSDLPIPHMGWNQVHPIDDSTIFRNLTGQSRFYFVHSYHVICENPDNVLATSYYGQEFTCAVRKGNIYGVQFHPEKSHKFGMQLLRNFGSLSCE